MDRLNLIKAFVRVVETGSFVAAAKQLSVTPQLVSKYVKELENELEITLLNRSTRKISVTEAGEKLLSDGNRILEDYESLKATLRNEHVYPQGHLRISAPVTLGEQYLLNPLYEFSRLYPEISFDLQLSDRFVDLLDERFDVALRIGALEDSSLISRKLAVLSSVVCASPSYLSRRGRPENFEDLMSHECILDTNNSPANKWMLEGASGWHTLTVSGRVSVSSATAALHIAVLGGGIVFCPRYFAERELQSGALVDLFPGKIHNDNVLYAIFPENRHPAAKISAFVGFLVQHFKTSSNWA